MRRLPLPVRAPVEQDMLELMCIYKAHSFLFEELLRSGIFCIRSNKISLKFVDLTCFRFPLRDVTPLASKVELQTRKQLWINNGWDMIRLQQNVPHDITRRHEILNCVVIVIMSENMLPCVWNMILQQKKRMKRRNRESQKKEKIMMDK